MEIVLYVCQCCGNACPKTDIVEIPCLEYINKCGSENCTLLSDDIAYFCSECDSIYDNKVIIKNLKEDDDEKDSI